MATVVPTTTVFQETTNIQQEATKVGEGKKPAMAVEIAPVVQDENTPVQVTEVLTTPAPVAKEVEAVEEAAPVQESEEAVVETEAAPVVETEVAPVVETEAAPVVETEKTVTAVPQEEAVLGKRDAPEQVDEAVVDETVKKVKQE